MTTKITKLEAAQNALAAAIRVEIKAEADWDRVDRAMKVVKAGGALSPSYEDALIDAARSVVGNVAYDMTPAELATVADRAVRKVYVAARHAMRAAELAVEKAEKVAAANERRRAARKAA